MFKQHFYDMLGTENTSSLTEQRLLELPFSGIGQQQGESMIREVTEIEIREVFASMDPNRSPGPNGWDAQLFKEFWFCIGSNVCNVIKHVLKEAKIRGGLNSTHICLIPMTHNPTKFGDF